MKEIYSSWQDSISNPDAEGFDPEAGKKDRLPEDHDTPAAFADDTERSIPPDHPIMDSDIDFQEAYDIGETNASGARAHDEVHEDKDQALYSGQ